MTESILQQATDCGAFTLSYCTKRAPTCSPDLTIWTKIYHCGPQINNSLQSMRDVNLALTQEWLVQYVLDGSETAER